MIKFNETPTSTPSATPDIKTSRIKWNTDHVSTVDQNDEVKVSKPRNMFGETDPKIDICLQYIKKNYEDKFSASSLKLKAMVKQLCSLDISIVSNWGEEALIEQKQLVKQSTDRIHEFSALNGDLLLQEIIASCNKSTRKGMFDFIVKRPSASEFEKAVAGLRYHLDGLLTTVDTQEKTCKNNKVIDYLIVASAVGECVTIEDNTTDDCLRFRRQILQQATKNIEIALLQLKQTKEAIIKMMAETDHIMNVVIPSLSLSK